MRRFLLTAAACLCGLWGWAQEPAYGTAENIPYRKGDAYVDSQCRLDVYYPAGKQDFATVIWYHGGGLTGGVREIPQALRDQGFAVVGVGYRFTPRVEVADCLDDAAAAAAWVVEHIAAYGGDPQRIFLAGHSAGAYLTTMLGLDKNWLEPYGIDPDTTFVALIPYSSQLVTHFARRRELGLPDAQPWVDDMAPLSHVRPDCPPMLLLTGDREQEMAGRYEENAYFWRMMRLAGHPSVELLEFEGFDHANMPQAGHFAAVRYIRGFEQKWKENCTVLQKP